MIDEIQGSSIDWKHKISLWMTGIGSYYVFTWVYDYLIISGLLLYFGVLNGGILAMVLSTFIDLLSLKFYDWLKKDWLTLETIKGLDDKKGFVGKLFRFVHDKGSIITVLTLSLVLNAFVVTAYMRRGAYQYNGMTKRDWTIFLTSSIAGNGYWILAIAGGVTFIRELLMSVL